MSLYDRIVLREGSPSMRTRFLPGESALVPMRTLAARSRQHRVQRAGQTTVTFSNGIATKNITVSESTPKRAAAAARKKSRLTKAWKVVAVAGQPFRGKA